MGITLQVHDRYSNILNSGCTDDTDQKSICKRQVTAYTVAVTVWSFEVIIVELQ